MTVADKTTQMVARYARHYDEPDETTFDVVWVDRLTGKTVLRYDGADPANTNPAYGAKPDRDVFASKGLDIDAEIEAEKSAVPIRSGEAEAWAAVKARRARVKHEEEAAEDLLTFLGDSAATFDFADWQESERAILRPALEARGFKNISFYMIEQDSFGPLIRGCVALDPDGKRKRFFYG